MLKINIDNTTSTLSGRVGVYKTGAFDEAVKRFVSADAFVLKLAEGVFLNGGFFEEGTFRVEAAGRVFYFCTGIKGRFGIVADDVVFFGFEGEGAPKNDVTFSAALGTKSITAVFARVSARECDLTRIYRLTFTDGVNFPLLSEKQLEIVETEDKNVVVQGVAGSGKTNVCIDKIVFSASRAYAGKLLYTTFSRGLLLDTKTKVNAFSDDLRAYSAAFKAGKIRFADDERKRAAENRLGVRFVADGDAEIAAEAERIADFLDNRVDYMLIEDLFKRHIAEKDAVGEDFFIKSFLPDLKDHRLKARLSNLRALSDEVIFKEVYGYVNGKDAGGRALPREEYVSARAGLERREAEAVYDLGVGYANFLKSAGLEDNNTMSRKLIAAAGKIEKYSLAIVDEVQDMTEINLVMLKALSRKMFCVGDAMQMINPSFFGFAFLKRLLFEKEVATVAELTNNFRSTGRIAAIADDLARLNTERFGTHSFVMKSEASGQERTDTVFTSEPEFLSAAARLDPDDATFIVSGIKSKERLRAVLKRQEILTVSEAKGLERDNVALVRLLSDNADKWRALERAALNRKRADENSVYRYYFNLFYVGVTRARRNLFVFEDKKIDMFSGFFRQNFETENAETAARRLVAAAGSGGADREREASRISEFIKLGQYDNARFAAGKVADGAERGRWLVKIDVHERHTAHGRYREAGIELWRAGLFEEAREMFALSGDAALSELMDACAAGGGGLTSDAVRYYADVEDDEAARGLIISTLEEEARAALKKQREINAKLKSFKEWKK